MLQVNFRYPATFIKIKLNCAKSSKLKKQPPTMKYNCVYFTKYVGNKGSKPVTWKKSSKKEFKIQLNFNQVAKRNLKQVIFQQK